MTYQHTKSLGASIYMIVFFSFNDVILLCILQRDLQQKQAEQIVRNMLHNIIDGIKIQDRPPSPLDAYITEEEIFTRNNPKVRNNIQFPQNQ